MRRLFFLCALVAVASPVTGWAAAHQGIETSGQAVAIALPLIAAGISTYNGDWDGDLQLSVDTLATVGTSELLSHVVKERRPDGSDEHSFPSNTAALAFAPATYLWQRYGWEYGAPAYAAATFVGYSRVDAERHHWWDVAASAGMAFGYTELFVTRQHLIPGFETGATALPGGGYVHIAFRW